MIRLITLLLFLLTFCSLGNYAQVDPNTLLSLRFENSLNGESEEMPVTSTAVTYEPGVAGQSVALAQGSSIYYPAANNINSREGTIEFWIRPNWNGNDDRDHPIVSWNGNVAGGMVLEKLRPGLLLLSMDRGATWVELVFDIKNWRAGEWHYLAVTYSNTTKKLQIYTDGVLVAQRTFNTELPLIFGSSFQIGRDPINPLTNALDARLDEFRISDRVRTPNEIAARFYSNLTVTSFSLQSITRNLWPTWKIPLVVSADTNIGRVELPASVLSWTSSNPDVATVDPEGRIIALAPGTSRLTTVVGTQQAAIDVTVNAPVRPPKVEFPTGYSSTPPTDALYEIPVVSLRYIPTADGVNLDLAWAPGLRELQPVTVAVTEQRTNSWDEIRKFMLESGSRFRGYGATTPRPSLGYRVVAAITVYEPSPPGEFIIAGGDRGYASEYHQMFERFGIRDLVEQSGVKEIWYYEPFLHSNMPSYNPAIHPPENLRITWESNMSSPTTGDISNSNQSATDLPVYDRTYVVYELGLRRFDNVSLHVDGHQLEFMLAHALNRQDGNTNLFWLQFAGENLQTGVFTRGRAGDTHFPPNAAQGYDYTNLTPFDSDIRDWKPDGSGQKAPYNAETVMNAPYIYPNSAMALLPSLAEPNWYMFWRQSMPGYGNNIPYIVTAPTSLVDETRDRTGFNEICVPNGMGFGTELLPKLEARRNEEDQYGKPKNSVAASARPNAVNKMTNWWQIYGDWDQAIRSGMGLHEPANCSYLLSSSAQSFPSSGGNGSVMVASSSGCKWFASKNAMWTPLISGDIGNGSGQVNFMVQSNTSSSPRTTKIIVAGQPLVITQQAAQIQVTIGGRVTTPAGLGLRNAVVSIVDSLGVRRTATTSSFGLYSFANVAAGANYTINVSSKRYRFAARTLTVSENLSNVDFVGLE